MFIDRNKKIARLWFEEMWSKPNFEVANKIIHPDYNPEWVQIPKKGPEQVIHEIKYFRSAFHDLKYDILDIIADDTKVWVRYKATVKHGGRAWGFEATNKEAEIEGMSILEIDKEGKVVNQWGAFCLFDILVDLELVPPFWELSEYFPKKE
ncbi:MAG: ester cyclase [Candidatus Thorarchaeota archaeon]